MDFTRHNSDKRHECTKKYTIVMKRSFMGVLITDRASDHAECEARDRGDARSPSERRPSSVKWFGRIDHSNESLSPFGLTFMPSPRDVSLLRIRHGVVYVSGLSGPARIAL